MIVSIYIIGQFRPNFSFFSYMNVEPLVKDIAEIVERKIRVWLNYVTPIENRASYLTQATTSRMRLCTKIKQNP
jgi:hypothetical protein